MTVSEQQTGLRSRIRNVVNMFVEDYVEENKTMLKEKAKYSLTLKERLVLEFLMFSPVFIVFAVLYTTHSFLSTLVAFHIALTVGPILFLRYKKIHIDWVAMLKQDLIKHARNLNNDLMMAAAPSAFFVVVYVIFRNKFPDYDYSALKLPSVNDQVIAILLAIEFIIVNPFVEELFCRVFCDKFTGNGRTIANKLDVSIHFGIYHFFVCYFLSGQDIILSLAGMGAIMTLGYILTVVKQRYGLITAMVIHIGVDLAAGIAVLDLQTNFIPFY